MKKIILIVLALFSTIVFSACISDEVVADIYTSIYPVEFIVKEIVDEQFIVKSIYPRGKDIHDYESTPKDIIRMSKSKIVFYIGIGLEVMIEDCLDSTLKDVATIPLSTNLELIELNTDFSNLTVYDQEHVYYDPHVWLDPYKMELMTDTVLNGLFENLDLTEDQKTLFINNANKLKEEFRKLDQEFFDTVNDNQIEHKVIIVDHDAYVYWEQRYGIERIRIRNDNDSTDVIQKEMQAKIQRAKELGIQYICTTKNEMESSIIASI
jgi:zinc transport system substrate-binding protein